MKLPYHPAFIDLFTDSPADIVGGDVAWFLKSIKDFISIEDGENKHINVIESKEQGLSVIQYLQSGTFLERASEKGMTPSEYYEYEKAEMLRITGLAWS